MFNATVDEIYSILDIFNEKHNNDQNTAIKALAAHTITWNVENK
jgi:hypothetical protein